MSALTPGAIAGVSQSEQLFAATCRYADGNFGIAILNETGRLISNEKLPSRGHDLVQCKSTGNILVFARRPGVFAALFDRQGHPIGSVKAIEGRHFYGHGVFSQDGKLFFATENDFENANGIIGIYSISPQQIERIGEIASNGIGPHDIQLSADGQSLIVANGGIETHPDFARTKLNLSTMQPNVSWLDLNSGAAIARFDVPNAWHKLSLRHLASADGREIWVGGQLQENANTDVPLIAKISLDKGLEFLELPPEQNRALKHYIGSIEVSSDGGRIGVTSPKGHISMVFDPHGNVLQTHALREACPLAPTVRSGFQVGAGTGMFGQLGAQPTEIDGMHFDNHMIALS